MILLYILGAMLVLLILYVLFLLVCGLFVNPKKDYEKNSRFYRFLLQSAAAFLVKLLRIRIHVSGMEKLPENTRLLFVGNHRSAYDPILSWHVFRRWQLSFISKPSNFSLPAFGRIIRKCCFLPIDRQNPRNAIVTINRAADLLMRQEVSVGVYPEGTRSRDGALLPFHNGVFKIAQKAHVPIAVIAARGTETVRKKLPFGRPEVNIDVVDVLSAEEVQQMKTDEIGARVRSALESRLE